MKLKLEATKEKTAAMKYRGNKTTKTAAPPEIPEALANLAGFRLLKWNELVKRGDFVKDGQNGFELWEGPAGFRADAFVKSIYRRSRPVSL